MTFCCTVTTANMQHHDITLPLHNVSHLVLRREENILEIYMKNGAGRLNIHSTEVDLIHRDLAEAVAEYSHNPFIANSN